MQKQYLCIDLKSFYASVECVERGYDPMTTDLIVADPDRCEKTICLAVSPSLKAKGVPNRCRVFEIPSHLTYTMASPRMKLYIEYSANVYAIYLKYVSKNDIHVYSIDEAFLDVTDYLPLYGLTAVELGNRIRNEIQATYGLTATCGVGTNLYLAKLALDITAKHSPDFFGVLDEDLYRKTLWQHQPLTDFWRIGPGTVKKLAHLGIYTMEQLAHAPEAPLYKMFGVDAEILIDHAWGREPVTISDIHAYKSQEHMLSSGQVLFRGYDFDEALLVVKEMGEQLCLELTDKQLTAASISLYIGYEKNMHLPSNGSQRFPDHTASRKVILESLEVLFRRIVDPSTQIRRMTLGLNHVLPDQTQQLSIFSSLDESDREKRSQETMNHIKKKYGRNAIFKGRDLESSATALARNRQIGGHKSGE